MIRLFSLQILDPTYKQFATRNVVRPVVSFPARGLIYDRNGNLLVYNKAAYDLLVTPREVKTFDTTLLCSILEVSKEELIESLNRAKRHSFFRPSIVVRQISPEVYAPLQEKLYKFPGFFVQSRTLREYPDRIAAHLLGYVGEVDRNTLDRDPYYKQGDYEGKMGLERAYEKELRGTKGINFFLVDVHNRIKGRYRESRMDTAAVLGKNLLSTIDAPLQKYAEQLMQNKRGAVVAIEPATGEILVLLSSPSYDPNSLVGRSRSIHFPILMQDSLRPLTNRAISAAYSPGSTFKMINALIALDEGAINEHTSVHCSGTASTPIRCTHSHASPISLTGAIRESCNPYFWNTFRSILAKYPNAEEGYRAWRSHILSFGFGQPLTTELFGETSGNIPQVSYYDHFYRKGRWNALTIRSLSIGQGEIILTPLQMANMAAIIANRGYYYQPHLVRAIEDPDGETTTLEWPRKTTSIDKPYFDKVIEGMQQAVELTSARYTAFVNGITICGKTGTIQNPHGSDHSGFIAFAPKEEPRIAIAVYVENGVWGSRYAAPIASLIIEKYLNDSISPNRHALEKRMMETNLLSPFQPKFLVY